jgi:hypothetical protein
MEAALTPGNQPLRLIVYRLGGPQGPSGRYGEERKFLPLPRIEPRLLGRPAPSPSRYTVWAVMALWRKECKCTKANGMNTY